MAYNIDGGRATSLKLERVGIPRDAPRWLFFAGDLPLSRSASSPAGGLHVEGNCIVPFMGIPGFMHRGLITPMITVARSVPKPEVPVGMDLLSSASQLDELGRQIDYVKIPEYPGPMLAHLMMAYGGWGLTEIDTLCQRTPEEVAPLQINKTVYPDWPNDLPVKNMELVDYFKERRKFIGSSRHPAADILLAIVDEMIEGTIKTDEWMRRHLDAVHSAMKLPAEHLEHKSTYDRTEILFLERTGVPRYDSGLDVIATTQKSIGQIAEQLMQSGKQDQNQFLEALKLILAENRSQVAAEVSGRKSKQPKIDLEEE